MLPKNRRISRKEFGYILGNSKRHNSPSLLLYIAINNSNRSSLSKFSFSVSKKVCKIAVGRNRLRRLGYSVVSKKLPLIKDGFLLLFVFKKDSLNLDYIKLDKEIQGLLSDSGMLV